MKTHTRTPIAAVVAALAISALNAGTVLADTTDEGSGLIYNNRAYIHSIQGYPNPAADTKARNPEIVYVSLGNGPAIYSYPSNVAFLRTDFVVHYVDKAYGPAIYSYPMNTPVTHHRLNLVNNSNGWEHKLFTPVSVTLNGAPTNTPGSAF